MSNLKNSELYGVLTDPVTLEIERRLPGPVERVWSYLTDGELRRQWLASGNMKLEVGSSFELTWRNDELTDPPGDRPEEFSGEHTMKSTIVEVDEPRKLVYTWGEGEVEFTLQPVDGDVLLTLIHRRVSERKMRLMVGAGWHMHLNILEAKLAGRLTEPFWDGWFRLRDEYDQRFA